MPYFDASKSVSIQIRDRLRDLMEADAGVQSVYRPGLAIRGLPADDVTEKEELSVAVSIYGTNIDLSIAGRVGTNEIGVRLVLTLMRFGDDDTVDQQLAYDDLVTRTDTLVERLLCYQTDETPYSEGQTCRLWSSMRLEPQTTVFRKFPEKWWASDTIFTLSGYRRTQRT